MSISPIGYCNNGFKSETRSKTVAEAIKTIPKGLEFDAIAVRGISGTLIGAIVADRLSKDFIVVRKKEDGSSHSGEEATHGYPPNKYLIVDDFIASGYTVAAIYWNMKKHCPKAECVGVLTYTKPTFYDVKEPSFHYFRHFEQSFKG